jgi:hypothetical protein
MLQAAPGRVQDTTATQAGLCGHCAGRKELEPAPSHSNYYWAGTIRASAGTLLAR